MASPVENRHATLCAYILIGREKKMKLMNLGTSVQDDRNGLFEVLRTMNPRLCFWIGLIACASIAYYIPLIFIALTGVWVNNLTMADQLLVAIVFLIIQNLIGNRMNKIIIMGVVLAVVLDGFEAVSLLHATSWSVWQANWMTFFLPTVGCLLNAWLFQRFEAAAGLN